MTGDKKSGPAPTTHRSRPKRTSSTPHQSRRVSLGTQCGHTDCSDVPIQGVHGGSRITGHHEQRGDRGESPDCASEAKDGPTSPEHQDRRKAALSAVSPKYRKLLERAWDGSRKAAIRSHCLQCCGFSLQAVRLCADSTCPLFEFRLKG